MHRSPPVQQTNVRAREFTIARTEQPCAHCGRPTTLVALAVARGHETRADDDAVWQTAAVGALLFAVEYVPDAVARELHRLSPEYRRNHAGEAGISQWINHCRHCGAAQDEHELFSEPGGAFCPDSSAAAARISLLPIAAPFAALAGGYAYEPAFLGAISGP